MSLGVVATWDVLAPPGLTSTGRLHKFQNDTVERLTQKAITLADKALGDLRTQVEAAYQQGTGQVAESLDYQVQASRYGVEVNFIAAGRELQYLTSLAGEGRFEPEGHTIAARPGGLLRFFWKQPLGGGAPGIYHMEQVHWSTRAKRDVIAEVLSDHAARFEREMIRAHDQAVLQFVQQNAEPATRSPRVSAFRENQINPRY